MPLQYVMTLQGPQPRPVRRAPRLMGVFDPFLNNKLIFGIGLVAGIFAAMYKKRR